MVNKSKVDFFFGKFFKMKLLLAYVGVCIKETLTNKKTSYDSKRRKNDNWKNSHLHDGAQKDLTSIST